MPDYSYAIHLVSNHSSIFSTGFTPPPYLYFMAPWSPLLPPGHPDYYPSYFTWIPTSVIATQHVTVRLTLIRTADHTATGALAHGQGSFLGLEYWDMASEILA